MYILDQDLSPAKVRKRKRLEQQIGVDKSSQLEV
jgi:hypothetical protein